MRVTLILSGFIVLATLPCLGGAGVGPASQPATLPTTQSVSAGAGSSGEPLPPQAGDAVVAIVKEVDDANATFGNPPRVKLEIVELLRGDPKTDRTRAIWGPPDHGIDWGIVKENPLYKEWAKKPMKGPKVGEKYILWGRGFIQNNAPVFLAGNGGRIAFSDEERQRAIQMIKRDRELSLEYQKKMEAQRQAHQEAVKKWREGVSSDDIKQYAAKAEFIGIGKSGGDAFRITEILKGQQKKEFTDGAYYVTFEIPESLRDLLDRETTYVVFLRDTPKMLSASAANYAPIPLGDGVVIADEQTMKALGDLVSRKPTSASMPATPQPTTRAAAGAR
jgi:hypothetical protein